LTNNKTKAIVVELWAKKLIFMSLKKNKGLPGNEDQKKILIILMNTLFNNKNIAHMA